jgi:hypothetical protein
MSPDLMDGDAPSDPEHCSVFIEAEIGAAGEVGEEIFSFQVVTRQHLLKEPVPRWGQGLLIVERFSWRSVESSLQTLLMHAVRPTWSGVAAELAKELHWEFENYSEP